VVQSPGSQPKVLSISFPPSTPDLPPAGPTAGPTDPEKAGFSRS
jgi:hypothetical protein